MISFEANCPILIKITLIIVIFMPVHNDNMPYYLIIRLNAFKVFL